MTFHRLACLFTFATACANADPSEVSPDAPTAEPDGAATDAPVVPQPRLWAISNDDTANWLYEIDPVSFAIQRRTELSYSGVLWELAGTSMTTAYAIDRDSDTLVTIDLPSGAITKTVKLAGDIQQNGRGFGFFNGVALGIFSGSLKTIDLTTGALSQPATVEYGLRAEALEGCDGQLYMASRESGVPRGEKLYVVDRATGASTARGTIWTTAIDIDSLSCFRGRLYGVDADPALGRTLFEIDPATANAVPLVELPVAGTINAVHVADPSSAAPT